MDCPRCTNDLERITEERWVCPACGLVEYVPFVIVEYEPSPEDLREMRDRFTEVSGYMVGLAEKYPQYRELFAKIYHWTKEQAEQYDNLAGGQ